MGSGERKPSQGCSFRELCWEYERNRALGKHQYISEVSLNLPSPTIECSCVWSWRFVLTFIIALDQTANAYLFVCFLLQTLGFWRTKTLSSSLLQPIKQHSVWRLVNICKMTKQDWFKNKNKTNDNKKLYLEKKKRTLFLILAQKGHDHTRRKRRRTQKREKLQIWEVE